jgi:hypothetical protein
MHLFYFSSGTIGGLEELHNLGYYCPRLTGDDIAVIKQSGLIRAKIWNFCKCDPGKKTYRIDKS